MTDKGACVQIILPGLFDLPLHELETDFVSKELPGLNRILGLATLHDNQAYSIDAIIQRALTLESSPGLPMAQAFAEADEAEPARLILAEAVHLRADLHDAVVIPIPKTPDTIQDIEIIINNLNDAFKVDCDLSVIADSVFLLRLTGFDAPTLYPQVLSVLGKAVNPFIEQSRQVLPWYRLLNEIQMYMHQHPVNVERMRQGRLPINSLWFWGAGERPAIATRPRWFCDDALLNRFAASLGLVVESCSGIGACADFSDTLIVDLRLLQWLKAGLDTNLDEILLDIERKLLAPVLQEFAKSRLTLHLRAGYRHDLELRPSAKIKFWRRPGSLDAWKS
ncbi:MAG: hypothetical protein GY785_11585 [Gammaproteobacteria bacterium]|nr:hypothetical protein [Gammaproteobacteria bacterium]